MLLILHVIIAISSIGVSGLTLVKPTKNKLNLTYAFVALTLVTGTILIYLKPSHLVSSCFSGLIYLSIVLPLVALSQRKLYKKL